jgi:hypothetical protein
MRFFAPALLLAAALTAPVLCATPALSQTSAAPDATGTASPTDSPDVASLRQVETDWANGLAKRDQFAVDLALAPNYVGISGTGEVLTKNETIASLYVKDLAPDDYKETITSIRPLTDVGIVQGTYRLTLKGEEQRGIFTHVYLRTRSTWQCVNSQRTIVVEKAVEHETADAKKKNELGLKMPFFGKKKNGTAPDTPDAVNSGVTPTGDNASPNQPAADVAAPPPPQTAQPQQP